MRRLFLLFWLALGLAHAEEPGLITPLERSLHGLPIVKVRLFRGDGSSKEVRMVVDTGCAITAIDRTLDSGFWCEDKALKDVEVEAVGAGGVGVTAEPVLLQQLQCGPLSFKLSKAVRLDLSAINSGMDLPIAGFIGMNLLRGQCFRMDLRNQVLRWGGGAEGAYLRDLKVKKGNGVPRIQVEVAGHRIEAICDTGMAAFMHVSETEAKVLVTVTDPLSGVVNVDISGKGQQEKSQTITGVAGIGSKIWCNPEVEVAKRNLLGINAMWPSVWFDFKKDQVGFTIGADGCLESRPLTRQALHAYWDRSGDQARLIVLGVKPGSLYETEGLRAGDVLLAFGDLEGDALNLASLRQAVLAQKAGWVVVQRKGQTMRIKLPERNQTP